jgi:hypothetical protein
MESWLRSRVFAPLQQQEDVPPKAKSGYIPPGIIAVACPAYPVDAASIGAVVVRVKVGPDGKVEDIKEIRSFHPYQGRLIFIMLESDK